MGNFAFMNKNSNIIVTNNTFSEFTLDNINKDKLMICLKTHIDENREAYHRSMSKFLELDKEEKKEVPTIFGSKRLFEVLSPISHLPYLACLLFLFWVLQQLRAI